MDTKNVIAAISLSAAVIVLWGLFFAPSPDHVKKVQLEKERNELANNEDAPKLIEKEEIKIITRESAINESSRITFENENIIGSISLNGAVIDDLRFKKYKTELNGNENIVLLNPRDVENGYIVETGWASNSKNIDLPNYNTIWNIKGNTVLTPTSPITLSWTNNQNITFIKKWFFHGKAPFC